MAEPRSERQQKFHLNLAGFQQGDDRPEVAVYAIDRSGKQLAAAHVDASGGFTLPAGALKEAHRILIGPRAEKADTLPTSALLTYRPAQFLELAEQGALSVAERWWRIWHVFTYCVTGHVSHCYRPWVFFDLAQAAVARAPLFGQLAPASAITLKARAVLDASRISPVDALLPRRCDVVCSGVVEVYRRTCCCRPWVLDDPRLPDLLRDLEDLLPHDPFIPDIPDIPFPVPPRPGPGPDPAPFDVPFIKDGALDKLALNASHDLRALRTLPRTEIADYINARPYLLCIRSCSAPVRLAQGFINPDGRFQICWSEPPRPLLRNCHDEYAYVVRQIINGMWVTIYDGLAANIWFHYEDDASLVSYHRLARSCRHNDFPGEGAFALLQDIGDTNSWRLATPNATGWDRVGAAAYNSGLLDPVATAAAALGKLKNRNLGGTLKLLYHFSEAMKTVGAVYYRISVRPTDATGQPTGGPEYLSDGLSWKYMTGGGDVLPDTLGPVTVGGQNYLYKIPYDVDRDWQGNQYHGYLDTNEARFNTPGRWLLTLEVFNAAGQRLRPTGTADPGDGVVGATAGFTFRRWYQEFGPTANVPHAALTHMLWWDNRKAEALIVDLRVGGAPFTGQCQFLEGPGTQTFSVGYRAYHPQEMFLLEHSLWWRRGLGGPSDNLVNASPFNAGYPPMGPVAVSPAHTFAHMLTLPPLPASGAPSRCTFSLHLRSYVKTTDGEVNLTLGDYDYGSFALGITS